MSVGFRPRLSDTFPQKMRPSALKIERIETASAPAAAIPAKSPAVTGGVNAPIRTDCHTGDAFMITWSPAVQPTK